MQFNRLQLIFAIVMIPLLFICILTSCADSANAADSSSVIQPASSTPQADLLIKSSAEADTAYQTDNTYQQVPSDSQIKTVTTTSDPASFKIKVQNDSTIPQSYCIKAVEDADSDWDVHYTLDNSSRLIDTYVGGGTGTADGTDAKSIKLTSPTSLAYDHHGNLYIGCYGYIWRMDTNNKVYRFAGNGSDTFSGDNGPAINATLTCAYQMVFDSNDNLYFSDYRNNRVRRIDSQTGIITTVAGNGTQGYSGDGGLAINAAFYTPCGVALDSSGNIFVSDMGNNRIRKIDATTQIISTFAGTGTTGTSPDGTPALQDFIGSPANIALDSNGDLYIDSLGSYCVLRIDATSGLVYYYPNKQTSIGKIFGICIDKFSNNIYESSIIGNILEIDSKTSNITTIAGNNSAGFSGDGGPATSAVFKYPLGITTRDDGALLIADCGNNRVRIIESAEIPNTTMNSGYTTDVIPAGGSIILNATMTPSSSHPANLTHSITFNAYANSTDSTVEDSVEAIANIPVLLKPDLLIKKQSDPDTSYVGDQVYQTSPQNPQILGQSIQPIESANFAVLLKNEGNQSRTFVLKSTENNIPGWNCSYTVNSNDITADIMGSGYTTPVINPGASLLLDASILAAQNATGGYPKTATISVIGKASDTTILDSIQISADTSRPDLMIKSFSESDSAYKTPNVFQEIPSDTQIETIPSNNGDPVTFSVRLLNGSSSPQSYYLKATGTNDDAWTTSYRTADNSRIMTTIAGGGTNTTDGVEATTYLLPAPRCLVYDHLGNLYIGIKYNILKMDTNGKIYHFAGTGTVGHTGDGGPALEAEIGNPYGIAVDKNNNIYITEGDYIRRIDGQTGIITTIIGTGSDKFTGDGGLAVNASLYDASSIAIDDMDNIYIADCGNNRIRKIDSSTQIIQTVAGGGVNTPIKDGTSGLNAYFTGMGSITLDSIGNLYISTYNKIWRYNTATGLIYAAAGNGFTSHSGDGVYATAAGIGTIFRICADKENNLYLSEDGIYIRKIDGRTGIITTIAGDGQKDYFAGDGGPAIRANVTYCSGITAKEDGSLLICNYYPDLDGYGRIRMIQSPSATNNLAADGYTTYAIPAHGYMEFYAMLTPNTQNSSGSNGVVTFAVYSNSTDTTVKDSVEGIGTLDTVIKPDLLLKNATDPDSSYMGDKIYESIPQNDQELQQTLQPNGTAKYSVLVKNQGNIDQSFTLKATESKLSGWTITYLLNGIDVTGSINNGTCQTPSLSIGSSCELDVTITASQNAVGGYPATSIISAFQTSDLVNAMDSVQVSAITARPDLLIKLSTEPDTSYEAENVYQSVPTDTQIKSAEIPGGSPITYKIKVQNECDASHSYYLMADESTESGWTLRYSLDDSSRLISNFAGDGYDTSGWIPNLKSSGLSVYSITKDHHGNTYIGGESFIVRRDSSGIIHNVVGNGLKGFSGDGGPAQDAFISNVCGMAVDSHDNLYFSDILNHRIRRIDAQTGIITTVAGNGTAGYSGDNVPANSSSLNCPQAIAIDESGNIYIADSYNNRIRKVDGTTGIITTIAGTGVAAYNGDGIRATTADLNRPYGVALDSNKHLYICDTMNTRIRKVDLLGGIINTIAGYNSGAHNGDGGLASEASISYPVAVCVDKYGDLYIHESQTYYIRKIDAITGIIDTVVGGNGSTIVTADAPTQASFPPGVPGMLAQDDGSILFIEGVSQFNLVSKLESEYIPDIANSTGYTTDAIPANGNIYIDVTLVSSIEVAKGSEKTVDLYSYNDVNDTTVRDTVEALTKVSDTVISNLTYTSPTSYMHDGWNLVSLPSDPMSTDLQTVFSGIDVANSSFQFWDNTADPCTFQAYGGVYGWTGPAVRGIPYWFIGSSNEIISYQGNEPTEDFILTIPAHANAPYWISIGTPFPSAISTDSIQFKDVYSRGDNWLSWTSAYSGYTRVVDSAMQGWDNTLGSFVRVAPSAYATTSDKTQLDPWWGYWLLVIDKREIQIKIPKPVQ